MVKTRRAPQFFDVLFDEALLFCLILNLSIIPWQFVFFTVMPITVFTVIVLSAVRIMRKVRA